MKYFFELGSNPALSVAEIYAVLGATANFELFNDKMLIVDSKTELDVWPLIRRLGGVAKMGVIEAELNQVDINNNLQEILEKLPKAPGKFSFGFSVYGKINNLNINKLGLTLKKIWQNQKLSCRWVMSKEVVLSSVTVSQNKLLTRGWEAVFIGNNSEKILLGRTLAVQAFKSLSYRDFGRPGRDDHSGMLPPKLAQIMLNLAQPRLDSVILDPFCGSGTVLTEAILMGHQELIGSDISEKALIDTQTNIDWIVQQYKLENKPECRLYNLSAARLTAIISPNSIDAIATEPFLGPQRGTLDLVKIKQELDLLYSQTLKQIFEVLKPGAKAVMVWPIFFQKTELNPELHGLKIEAPLPEDLLNDKRLRISQRQTIIYGRPEQRVWREIVILKKFLN